MNGINKLTIFRILLIPIVIWLMYANFGHNTAWALGVFLLSSLAAWFGENIAKSPNQTTTLDKLISPLATKLLVTAALIVFVDWGFSGIPMIIIISCEMLVTGLRFAATSQSKEIEPSFWDKLNTVVQVVMIAVVLFAVSNPATAAHIGPYRGTFITRGDMDTFTFAVVYAVRILIYVMLAATVISSISYVQRNRELLENKAGGQ